MQIIDARLIDQLGSEAAAHLLGTDLPPTGPTESSSGAASLSDQQTEAVKALEAIGKTICLDDGSDPFSCSFEWANRLLVRTDEGTLGSYLRAMSTGSTPIAPDLTSLEGCLSAIITDLYVGLLLPASSPFGASTTMYVGSAYYRHPFREVFERFVMQDKHLKMLFPDEDQIGRTGYVTRSTGQGGSLQLLMFATELAGAGLKLTRFERSRLTLDLVIGNSLRCLELIRGAIRGERVLTPMRVGLAGVLLPEGQSEIDFGWARLRRADERDAHYWVGTSLVDAGTLTTTTGENESVEINYRGDLVLELETPYELSIGQPDFDAPWPAALSTAWEQLGEMLQNVQLGLLLAAPDTRPLVVTTWQSVLDPISPSNGMGWSDVRTVPNLVPRKLTADDLDLWKRWSKLVGRHRTPAIGVAIRRMLMAVGERHNPADVLVDAVIVWENLFGAKSETTFRIASSLALLLSPEDATASERLERQRSYKRLYGQRSEVVHGSPIADAKLQEAAASAVSISIAVLRELFDEQVCLLNLKTSEERSLHLIHRGDKKA